MEQFKYTDEEKKFILKWCHPEDVKRYSQEIIYTPLTGERITPLLAAILQKKAWEKLDAFNHSRRQLVD